MGRAFLADVILVVHLAYVALVVVGQLLILAGLLRGWRWVRNRWFRCLHLLAIAIVAFEAIFNIDCPLTLWEAALRSAAGHPVSGESFVGRLLHNVLFWNCPPWALGALHVAFGLVVLTTFVLAPPRWRRVGTRAG